MAGLLDGHIAAVTGGGSGIGQGICQAYAREGARVIILDANLDGANETVGLIEAVGGKASAIKLDVRDREACKAAAADIGKSGKISILVNNAGINRRNPFTGDAAAVVRDWDDIISINLDGRLQRHARLPRSAPRDQGPHRQYRLDPVVRACPHAELGRLHDLQARRARLHPRAGRRTRQGRRPRQRHRPGPDRDRDQRRGARQQSGHGRTCSCEHTPLGRAGKPEDIVGPAVFLASDMSAYVTGSHHHGRRRLPDNLILGSGTRCRTRKSLCCWAFRDVLRNYWGALRASTASIGTSPQALSFSFPAAM